MYEGSVTQKHSEQGWTLELLVKIRAWHLAHLDIPEIKKGDIARDFKGATVSGTKIQSSLKQMKAARLKAESLLDEQGITFAGPRMTAKKSKESTVLHEDESE